MSVASAPYAWSNIHATGTKRAPNALDVSSMLRSHPPTRKRQDATQKTKKKARASVQTTLAHLKATAAAISPNPSNSSKLPKKKKDKKANPPLVQRYLQPMSVSAVDSYVENKQALWKKFLAVSNTKAFNPDVKWHSVVTMRERKPGSRESFRKRMKLTDGEERELPRSISAFEEDIHTALDSTSRDSGTPKKKKQKNSKPRRKRPPHSVIERSVFFSLRTWSQEYRDAVSLYVEKLGESLPVFPRADKVEGLPVKYAKNGDCSLCRRKTVGFSQLKGGPCQRVNYAYYKCKCTQKRINHCLRCKIVEYSLRARKKHGEFRIFDKSDPTKVIGFKPIACKRCKGHWSPADLRLVGPPSEEQRTAVFEARKSHKKVRAFRPRGDVGKGGTSPAAFIEDDDEEEEGVKT